MNLMTFDGPIGPEKENAMMTCKPDEVEQPQTAAAPQRPWATSIAAMDRAIFAGNATAAVRAWREAYAAALDDPGWAPMVDVAAACRRIGVIPGFAKTSEARARETYWTALFRARRQGSLNGVLQAAEAFGALGDRSMVEQCIHVAERLAALTGDADAAQRVRTLAANLMERYVEAGRQSKNGGS
ncbi:MAG TPA: hypothetical protein VGU22_06855 [Methylomirabilota bacterium]|jgi:hypothetical protein|nr:hypothetical protein [Methylomirabilota bacterium]